MRKTLKRLKKVAPKAKPGLRSISTKLGATKKAKAPGKFVVGPAPSPLASKSAAIKTVSKPKPRVRRKPKIRKAITRRGRVY